MSDEQNGSKAGTPSPERLGSQDVYHGSMCPDCGGMVRWTESETHAGSDLQCDSCGKVFEECVD